jgi:hypothetical protein
MSHSVVKRSFLGLILLSAIGPMNRDKTIAETKMKVVEAFPALHFASPVDFKHPNDGSHRLFVLEQEGTVKIFEINPM